MYIPALSNIHGICMVYTMCMVYTIHIPCNIFIGVPDAPHFADAELETRE